MKVVPVLLKIQYERKNYEHPLHCNMGVSPSVSVIRMGQRNTLSRLNAGLKFSFVPHSCELLPLIRCCLVVH